MRIAEIENKFTCPLSLYIILVCVSVIYTSNNYQYTLPSGAVFLDS